MFDPHGVSWFTQSFAAPMLVPAYRCRMLDTISERWVPSKELSPPLTDEDVIAPWRLVMSVSPIGLRIVPLISRSGPLVWLLVMVTSDGSTWRTIANLACPALCGLVYSVTTGLAVRLITSMSSITSWRSDSLRIVTVCQLSRKVNVPQ